MLWNGGRRSNITQVVVTKFIIRSKVDLKTKEMNKYDQMSTCLKITFFNKHQKCNAVEHSVLIMIYFWYNYSTIRIF